MNNIDVVSLDIPDQASQTACECQPGKQLVSDAIQLRSLKFLGRTEVRGANMRLGNRFEHSVGGGFFIVLIGSACNMYFYVFTLQVTRQRAVNILHCAPVRLGL